LLTSLTGFAKPKFDEESLNLKVNKKNIIQNLDSKIKEGKLEEHTKKVKIDKPISSCKSGRYTSEIKVKFTNNYSDSIQVYYTTNGVIPSSTIIKSIISGKTLKNNHGWNNRSNRNT
jgi:hypothetical protein